MRFEFQLLVVSVCCVVAGVGCHTNSPKAKLRDTVSEQIVANRQTKKVTAQKPRRATLLGPADALVPVNFQENHIDNERPMPTVDDPWSAPPNLEPQPHPVASLLTIHALIEMTLKANPDLRAALERSHIASAALAKARAEFFPILTAGARYQTSNNSFRRFEFLLNQDQQNPAVLFAPPDVGHNLHTQLRFKQMLYSGGLGPANLHAAEAKYTASKYSLAAVQNQLVYQVAEAYYRLFQAHQIVHVRQEAVAQIAKQKEDIQAKVTAEVATQADLLKVHAKWAEARESLVLAHKNQQLGWALLENLTGVRLAHYHLPQHLPSAPWSKHSASIQAAVTDALAQRPEIGASVNQQRAAKHKVTMAKAGHHPTVGLLADYDSFFGSTSADADSFYVGLAMKLKVFDGGRTRATVAQAKAKVREIMAQDRRVRLDIELDVRRAFLNLQAAKERLHLTAANLQYALEFVNQARSRYDNETGTLTDLLQAQVLLSEAHVRDSNAHAEVEIAKVDLERAAGRLVLFCR